MPMAEFAAGLDGGGTGTTLVCLDAGGAAVGEARFGAFNLNAVGRENFQALLGEIAAYLHTLGTCRSLCVGAAGISNPLVGQLMEETFREIPRRKLVGDHEIALYGALEGQPGLCVIAGTGSICCGRDREGRTLRLGGWGHLIGDRGSAYALGRDAFAAAARCLDGLGPETCLAEWILESCRLRDRRELIAYVYQGGKSHIAGAAPLVERAFLAGDPAAEAIMRDNAESLVELAVSAAEKLALRDAPVALMGGVLEGDTVMRRLFTERLAVLRPDLRCTAPRRSAAAGAAMMALKEM